jgi:Uma2 family endonuclease
MNVALRRTMTRDDFLAWEAAQPERYEFDGLQPIAMNGGTVAHATIATNLIIELGFRLRGKQCRAYGSDLKIIVVGRVRYPDAFVACSPVANDATWLTDPVVVFEVLSESTAIVDQTTKNAEYRATPSIQRYVMLSQESMSANVYERSGGQWSGTLITAPDAVLAMPELGIELPLAALYNGLTFDTPA